MSLSPPCSRYSGNPTLLPRCSLGSRASLNEGTSATLSLRCVVRSQDGFDSVRSLLLECVRLAGDRLALYVGSTRILSSMSTVREAWLQRSLTQAPTCLKLDTDVSQRLGAFLIMWS